MQLEKVKKRVREERKQELKYLDLNPLHSRLQPHLTPVHWKLERMKERPKTKQQQMKRRLNRMNLHSGILGTNTHWLHQVVMSMVSHPNYFLLSGRNECVDFARGVK